MRAPRARGHWSLLHRRNRSRVETLLYGWAKKKGVTIDRIANAGNHLHLLLRAPTHEALQQFLKIFAGLAARAVMKAKKGVRRGKFWEKTAYSRLIPGGAYRALCAYLTKNRLEAIGFRGVRLRFRESGEAVAVVGDPEALGLDPREVQTLIRGSPRATGAPPNREPEEKPSAG